MRRWVIPALVLGLHLLLLLGLQWGLRRANEKPMALPERIEFFLPPLVRQRPPPKEDKKNARRPTQINRNKVVADTHSPTVDEALPAILQTATPAAFPAAVDTRAVAVAQTRLTEGPDAVVYNAPGPEVAHAALSDVGVLPALLPAPPLASTSLFREQILLRAGTLRP